MLKSYLAFIHVKVNTLNETPKDLFSVWYGFSLAKCSLKKLLVLTSIHNRLIVFCCTSHLRSRSLRSLNWVYFFLFFNSLLRRSLQIPKPNYLSDAHLISLCRWKALSRFQARNLEDFPRSLFNVCTLLLCKIWADLLTCKNLNKK